MNVIKSSNNCTSLHVIATEPSEFPTISYQLNCFFVVASIIMILICFPSFFSTPKQRIFIKIWLRSSFTMLIVRVSKIYWNYFIKKIFFFVKKGTEKAIKRPKKIHETIMLHWRNKKYLKVFIMGELNAAECLIQFDSTFHFTLSSSDFSRTIVHFFYGQ